MTSTDSSIHQRERERELVEALREGFDMGVNYVVDAAISASKVLGGDEGYALQAFAEQMKKSAPKMASGASPKAPGAGGVG
ncbi:hypothetical protein [Azospirillum palustre]